MDCVVVWSDVWRKNQEEKLVRIGGEEERDTLT